MAVSPAKAVSNSMQYTRGFVGLCLVFVRTCYGIAAKYPSAAEAWKNAKKRHTTNKTAHIPTGAPVFFSVPGNKYGHVALYLGGGKFRTNWSAKGTVITANLNHPVFNTMKMLGWTEDLNGVTIKGLVAGNGSDSLKHGSSGKRVLNLQKGMNKAFPAYANFAGDGKYGDYTVKVVKEFQRRTGLVQDGVAGPQTIAELAKYGVHV